MTPPDICVQVSIVGVIYRVPACELCQERSWILGVGVKKESIDRKEYLHHVLVSTSFGPTYEGTGTSGCQRTSEPRAATKIPTAAPRMECKIRDRTSIVTTSLIVKAVLRFLRWKVEWSLTTNSGFVRCSPQLKNDVQVMHPPVNEELLSIQTLSSRPTLHSPNLS